jgi:hypothetical protein
MNSVVKTAITAIIAYSSHFGITKLYTTFCIPDGFYGYIQGFLTTGGPICSGLLNMMTHTQLTYSTLLVTSMARMIVDVLSAVQKDKTG